MKKYLYLDNFRGFTNTFIPIADVNFLVGENSAGKTSVLGLLKLLSSPRFWFDQDFDSEDVRFGHFRDIVSIHSEVRDYFRVGFFEEWKESGKETAISVRGFLFTYREHEGLPRVAKFTYNQGAQQYSLRFARHAVFQKSSQRSESPNIDAMISTVFPEWIREHEVAGKGYTQLPRPEGFPPGASIRFVLGLSLLAERPRAKGSRRSPPGFQLPAPGFREICGT